MTNKIIGGMPKGTTFIALLGLILVLLGTTPLLQADEPFARSKDYHLEHSRIALHFDLGQKKVFGDVTHTLTVLRGTQRIVFDSAGLQIQSVTVNKAAATFETADDKLRIALPKSAVTGDKFSVEIKYEGRPAKGLYFILPDKDYPNRPAQVWTQGESEDTRYYLPTYDYPNDRLTTETILTVPAGWITVSNGKLISVSDAGSGLKTWTWRESLPSSTYLFTVVAGEFIEVKDTWRSIPVTYYAPKDRGDRLTLNYARTPAMIDLFSKKLGVDYPWEKYAQSMVDDFVAGGMENSSATTNTSTSLRHPKLVPEYPEDEDPLISHELAHQWFGDLVTCKDWGNIWLNEGFATYMESVWTEAHFGKDAADYERWKASREWFSRRALYTKSIVRHDFDDSSEFDGNAYAKGAWILHMLRHQLGDESFYAGLKHYLEVHRGKNVVTADLTRAIEEATHINLDEFFSQWIYGAGAPKLDVGYTYDEAKKQVVLTVKQTQKIEGRVGLFRFPVDVEITNATGPKLYNIVVSKESESFPLPSDSAQLMVLFDKGTQILKSTEFKKDKKELLFQLKNATELADRADAAVALGKMKNDDEAAAALGEALRTDRTDGVRITVAQALGELNTPVASRQLLDSLSSVTQPWIRYHLVDALASFKEDPAIKSKMETIARDDSSYRTRATALQALGRMKTPNSYELLTAAVNTDSPDGVLRNAALRAFGSLEDDKAVPLLSDWAAAGKDMSSREAAIGSLARLQKGNKELTSQIAAYLSAPQFRLRMTAVFALGSRGDASAIPALEALLHSNDLSIEVAPMIKRQIEGLKNPKARGRRRGGMEEADYGTGDEEVSAKPTEDQRLSHLEQLVEEMNDRLKSIETRLPSSPAK